MRRGLVFSRSSAVYYFCVWRSSCEKGGMTIRRNKSFPSGSQNYDIHKHFPYRLQVQELENMASVETVSNTFRAINDGGSDRSQAQNGGNQENSWQGHSEGSLPRDYGSTSGGNEKRKCLYTPAMEDALRRRLKFFFMDPCSKFRARRHWPWKLSMQVLKIVIITVQIVIFGGQRSEVVEYFERNHVALKHLLLKGWEPSYETMPYPPATGAFAIYHKNDFFDSIDHAWQQYYNLQNISLTPLSLMRNNGTVDPMTMCWTHNNFVQFSNGSFVVGPGVVHNCTELVPVLSGGEPEYNIQKFLANNNISIEFERLLELKLEFQFGTFHLNLIETHYGPTCYRVAAKIGFTNYERSGQVIIDLDTNIGEMECSGKIMSPEAEEEELSVKKRAVAFDVVVILICLMSLLLCGRSLVRGWSLKRKTEKFFKVRFGKTLDFSDRMEFVNLWYILITVNDVVTIIGSAFKIQLEIRKFSISSENYDLCSIMLGLGGLMAWIGCLRYLGFFKKYNILILTLKTAFPNVLRFSVCALALYFGFMFCGWVILAPYHIKFRHLSTASECLFSLVNGDDMFVTFSATESDNTVVWYFSQVYLYVFVSLFIYCVLSLFIAVIMDTYETLKEYYAHGFPKSLLQCFIEECNDPINSGLYQRQHTETDGYECSLVSCFNMCCSHDPDRPNEHTGLLTRTI
ncbi:mucolipin-3-like isoform X2 [Pomacea canaliculata]|uniref:mucolipin-3-like isoform X2 n=1 Tax=Pomacea canaliculata TaxID=400727 RepID=UPI000D732CE6|nr:mucolipin-3-like isoform X2 [Pomacea canaliculata]